MPSSFSAIWFRRDLRLEDNAALYHALRSGLPVIPVFIFDREILDRLEDRDDARVSFLHQRILELNAQLQKLGSALEVRYGSPLEVWSQLMREFPIKKLYCNRDYEPYALDRDKAVKQLMEKGGGSFFTYKDHVIFEAREIKTKTDGFYTVFTPYSRAWRSALEQRMEEVDGQQLSYYFKSYPCERHASAFAKTGEAFQASSIPSLDEMGFRESSVHIPAKEVGDELIERYDRQRDIPGIAGTSRLGIHFRFGTISIRSWARRANKLNQTFLNELIWRDFYSQVLQVNPRVEQQSFRPEYDAIPWRNDEHDFARWCEGTTGYPIVDAGMRELNATGFMHNRVRMVTASFLTKHLLIDWRWGERYFARKLLDYDLASNNGGWQWAAGSGTDAAPYFRVFSPDRQQEKFDPQLKYIKKWVPELGTSSYPAPMVEHSFARERAINTYREALASVKA